MIYIIRNGETFLDAVLNGSGSIDNYEEILNANNFTDWTPAVSVGQQIVIPDDIVRQQNVLSVLNKYPANNNYAAADFMIQVLALINKANPVSDQLIDKDGNIYTTIDIGTLRIIVQNFKCTKYADGSAIPNITADGTATVFTDWFLPSRDELSAMQTQLYLYGVGGFASGTYWSSTEFISSYAQALALTFSYAGGNYDKSSLFYVRACRTFTTTSIYALRDLGQAGGLIFHITDNGGGSYTYYEAAPTDQSSAQEWSNISTAIGASAQGTAIGTGQANTTAVISQAGQTDSAAKLCDDLSVSNGGTGWLGDTSGAYCWYNNDSNNKDTYGLLYNWYAINNVKGLAYLEKNGVQDTDFRVWNDADINYLITLLGGSSLAGGKLKEMGLVHWVTPNSGATDDYGFKGLPGGDRQGDSGTFEGLGNGANFKSSSSTGKALTLTKDDTSSILGFFENYQHYGFSVRLVKDIVIDDDMKYEQVINLTEADNTTVTTSLTTTQVPFTYLIEDSSGNPIGGEEMIVSRTLIGGVWVLVIYSTTGYTGATLKIVY